MSKAISSGILIYKFVNSDLKVFLVHPGGPFWENKDIGAWSIPKGEQDIPGETTFQTAIREVKEETGISLSNNEEDYIYLDSIRYKNGKTVHCYAVEGDWPGLLMCQSYIEITWPPKSGKKMKIPEVDKADFFSIETAKQKINPSQKTFISRLQENLKAK
jgi:predicted NUDIX family NTP pyrophosphohydrolase